MALTIEELLGIQREREERVREAAKKIAPSSSQRVSSSANDIAPVRTVTPTTTQKNSRTWFKTSSYFDDGYDRWDVTKTILGTLADIGEDLTAGIADIPEKVTDALTMLGTAMNRANINQANYNMMSSPLAVSKSGNEYARGLIAQSNAIQKETEKTAAKFVAKDLYDAEKVAKSIVSAPIKSLTGMDVESASVLGEKSDSLVQSAGQLLATAGLNAVGVPWFLTTGATSFGGQAETALNEGADYNQAFMSATISAGAEILSEKLSGGIKFKLPGQEAAKTLDDVLLKPLTEKISNKVVKSLANFGIDALGEGGEEVFSSVVTNLGTALYKEENLGEILWSEEAWDEYIESFIGGMALGGGSSVVRSIVNRNAIELDEIDQKVYDKVVEDRIAEAKANGEDVTKAKEKEIRKAVLRELIRGGIDTDIVESVHGEDMYASYKDILDKFDNYESKLNDGVQKYKDEYSELQKEYDKLNELNLNKAKLGDYNRQTEIKNRQKEITDQISQWNAELKKLNGSKTDKTMTDLKNKLSKTVYEKVKNSRVAESYREIERQYQKFEADLESIKGTKYEEAARKTYENAVKAGANNTNRIHDLVDMNAKLSADTGIVFEYKSGEEIKQDFIERQTKEIANIEKIPEAQRTEEQIQDLAEMKDTLEKVQSGEFTVNGDITSDSITLNLDSKNPLEVITGHEITHSFENAEAYEKLKDTLFEYAKSKGVDIDGKLAKLKAQYKGVKDANPERELVADLVGEYLFTDYDFVKHLSISDPKGFKWLWNEIKYLCKIATAGSKEARQLEKVKHQFEKAYKESAELGAKVEGVKNSLLIKRTDGSVEEISDARTLTDEQALSYLNQAKSGELRGHTYIPVRKDTPQVIIDSLKQVGENVDNLSLVMQVRKAQQSMSTKDKRGNSQKTGNNIRSHSLIPEQILEIVNGLDNPSLMVYQTERYDKYGKQLPNNVAVFVDYNDGQNEGTAVVEFDSEIDNEYIGNEYGETNYHTVVTVFEPDTIRNGEEYDYAQELLENPNNIELEIIRRQPTESATREKHPNTFSKLPSSKGILPQNSEKSSGKTDYSLSTEQEAYFKDSKVRDENGNLKVMYHGTSKGGFTSFDTYGSNYGLMGTGSYFTDNKSVAESYTNKGKGNNKQVYESYLNITNPIDMDAQGNAEEWSKAFPEVDFSESGTNEQFYREVEEYYSDQMMLKSEVAEIIRDSIQFGMGYDGITHIGGGRVNADGVKHQVYIAFEPEQIKNIDNTAPTKDADIRYSLTETDNKYLSAAENGDTETAQKMVDEAAKKNGYTIKAYHGSRNEFNAFSRDKRGSNTKTEVSKKWFFAADKETANSYYPYGVIETLQGKEAAEKLKNKGKLYDLYIKMDNPLVVDVADYDYAAHRENADAWMEYVQQAEENGNDGIVLLNALDNQLKTSARESTVYMFKDSSQAKSADTVTYDDNGNVIPLSERFKSQNNDIRYNITTEYSPSAKTRKTKTPTNTNLQKDQWSVRDIRSSTMLQNGYTQADVDQVNSFMDNLATFMEKAGVTYQFVGINDINNAKVKVVYDKDGTPMRITMSAMVKNGEYPVNFDFTTICKKRQSMSMVIEELARRKNGDGLRALDEIDLDAKSLWTINEELRKAGLETACLGCFVESKRYNIQNFANKATTMWNSIVDEIRAEQGKTGTVESFNFAEGIDLDKVNYSKVDKIFKAYRDVKGRTSPEKRMRALIQSGGEVYQKYLQPSDLMTPEGIEGLKSLSTNKNDFYGIIKGVYGQAAPKEVMSFSPYNSEIALLPDKKGKKMKMAEYIASIGGVRMQSFSDFVVSNVYDYMQMVADLSAKHLPAHAYTKEIAFAKIFGKTGIKINMSVMFDIDPSLSDDYAGLQFIPDANGTEEYNGVKGRFEYLVADKARSDKVLAETGERPYVQSIGFDEAVELQNTEGYSGNIGIIGVGYSYNHIVKMLSDNNIRYVIPYHSSSLPSEIKGVTNISKATDYTDFQNTKTASGDSLPGLGGFDIYKDVAKTNDPKQTAQNYLDYCKSKNYTPVFNQFDWHENYYKLLFDFDPYDTITGKYSPQTEVKNIYDGYNPAEGLTSTEAIENLIAEEMKAQNNANKERNGKISDVVDNVLEQLGVNSNRTGFSITSSDSTPSKSGGIYGSDFRVKESANDIAPVQQTVSKTEQVAPTQAVQQDIAPTRDVKAKATPGQSEELLGMSQIGSKAPDKKRGKTWSDFVRNFVSKGAVFETTALESGNRALEDKYKMWKDRSEAKAQYFMENGNGDVKSLKSIVDKAKKSGLYKEFDLYLAHVHNMSRMLYDKPVFGSDVTGDMSLRVASKLQKQHPEFKEWSKDLYKYNDYLLQKTVDGGLISQEFADELSKKYPNYVPIERIVDGSDGLNADGVFVGNPIKTAIGGSQAFESPLKAMAHRTTQVFKAVDKNAFGVELKNTLGGNVEATGTNTEDILDGLALMDDSLLQPGKDGKNPTFTVFENGNRVTFDISEEMYKALQPTTEALSREHKIVSVPSKLHKKVLTEYNLFFTARNFPKDAQEVIFNSKHPAKTYANMPVAVAELIKGGKYATEYWENGGKSNTYFDSRENDFSQDDSFVKKAIGLVPNGISKINDFVEAIPRLSEYIASRKNGATVEASMLDAARVTTDFADGGDVTKFFNRNGVTFLNASVQGVSQQVRNIRQAKAEGFKGVMKLVGKYALSGLPTILFNHLMWDDDEEYEELSEYVKDSYYVVAKYGDGQFVRIPKGRTAAVIQEAVEQVCNLITNEEVNWDDVIGSGKSVYESFMSNIAPNNPIDNNVLSPIKQAISGTAWYGDDIVPARLQDLPAKEQYDESTDSISKWLGEKTGISPYKINYLLNQYSGFIGDIVLPPLTAEAERGDGSALGNLLAPLKDQFVVDAVIKNRNPSDFYTLSDELEVKANSKDAADEDRVKQAYITNISYEMGDLYKQKREIQNSNLSDDLKFKQVREIQSQINEMAKNALETYENVKVDGKYATVNDIPYKFLDDKGKWYELYDYEVEKMNDATKILGITPGEYWGNKDEYDMKAFYPEKYAVLQEEGISVKDYKEKYEEKYTYYADDYSWAGNNPEKYTFSKAITDSVVDYRKITSELYDIRADKDENGNSISGTAKAKKQAYIWSLDIEEPQKYLLFKSEYNSYDDHNQEIVDYIIGRDDLTYEEKKTILTNIGFTIDDNGNISG